MQTISTDYKLEIKKPSRSFECKITIGNNIYTNDDIVDIILETIQPGEGFSIGNTPSQTLDLTLLNRGDIIYSTSHVKVEIGLKIGATIEYILMGLFNIDDIEKTDYTTKFTCYDNMIRFETPYFSSLTYPANLQQVVNELATKTGVQFTGSLPAYKVKKLEGFTCREILGYVSSLCGGNALITRDGKFTIITTKDIDYPITPDNYIDYKREEVKYKIGKISCKVGDKELNKGSLGIDSMEVKFENPWVTDSILNDIYTKLNGFEYLGYTMKWQGDISLDVGDTITCTDIKGAVRKIPILSQKFTYNGGLTAEIGAKGETKNKNSFNSSGSGSNKLDRVVTELLIVNEALINKANIQDLEAVSIRTQTIEAKTAAIEVAIIDVAHVSDLTAINANIEKLIAADATIGQAIIGKANITDLTASVGRIEILESSVGDIQTLVNGNLTSNNIQSLILSSDKVTVVNGFIKNAMIENLDVSKILAGDISTNKFRIKSDNGGIEIVGATQQFKDKNNRVRIQMGQDVLGNFNFILRGEDGTTTLIDHTGIKENAIANDLIKGNMISENAVGGKQIDYNSFTEEFNKDTNTHTLKSSKVLLDKNNQTLDIAFNTLTTKVDEIEVGGRNYFRSAMVSTYSPYNILSKVEGSTITTTYNRATTIKYFTISMIGFIPPEETCTISGYMKLNGIPITNSFFAIKKATTYGKEVLNFYVDDTTGYFSITQNWSGVWLIHTQLNESTIVGDIIIIEKLKFEKGNKPTDWTPAPEDTDQAINNVKEITTSNTTAINVHQGKISALISNTTIVKDGVTTQLKDAYNSTVATVDSISNVISEHTSTIDGLTGQIGQVETKTNDIRRDLDGTIEVISQTTTTANSALSKASEAQQTADGFLQRVSNIETNYATTQAMNSAISQKADSIKLEVSKDFVSKNDAINTYATKASMELTESQLRLDFFSIDIINLLSNSSFSNRETTGWNMSGIGLYTGNDNFFMPTDGWRAFSLTSDRGLLYQKGMTGERLPKRNSQYTFSLSSITESNIETFRLYIDYKLGASYVANQVINLKTGYNTNRYSVTFRTKDINYDTFLLYIEVKPKAGTTGYRVFSIGLPCLSKGENGSYTARQNEVISGSTEIDANGVTIYNGAIDVRNRAGNSVLKGDANGNLMVRGNLYADPANPILHLFGGCSLDATYNNEQGVGSAVRLKWDENNYIRIGTGSTDIYQNGIARFRFYPNYLDCKPPTIYFADQCKIDASAGTFRFYISKSVDTGIRISPDGTISFMIAGTPRHVFNTNGTKAGGTIVVDGTTLGMSPIDSPKVLLEDVLFDIDIQEEGTTVLLDSTFIKTISTYAVFCSNPGVIIVSKDRTSFTVRGYTGKVDFRVIGYRIGYEEQYYQVVG